LFFRVACINYESFWHDEIFTLDVVGGTAGEMQRKIVEVYDHPPLYFWLLWGWTRVCGSSETALRLFSALCGAGAAIGLGVWLRRTVSPRAGWIGLIAMAFHPLLATQSIFARMYALESLMAVGVLVLAHGYMTTQKREPWGSGLALVGLGAAMTTVHYFAFFFVIAVMLAVVVELLADALHLHGEEAAREIRAAARRRLEVFFVIAICAGGVLVLLIRPLLLIHVGMHGGPTWIEQTWGSGVNVRLLARVGFQLLGVRTQEGYEPLGTAGLAIASALACRLFALILIDQRRDKTRRRMGMLFYLAVLAPAVMMIVFSLWRNVLQGRYLICVAVAWCALLGLLGEATRPGSRWTRRALWAQLCLMAMTTIGYLAGHRNVERWDVVGPEIRGMLRPGDALVLHPPILWVDFDHHAPDMQATGAIRVAIPGEEAGDPVERLCGRVAELLRGGHRVVCIVHHPHLWDPEERLRGTLERESGGVATRALPGRSWWLFVAESPH
jgi:uncharacterized membrane protein